MFKDGNSREGLGIGIEGNNLRIEPIPYFFDDTTDICASLGLVTGFKISVATDYIFNLLKVGYRYRENDTLNGKDDPHTTGTWSTEITNIKNELDLVSDFVASMYTWEYMRS
jgi:hypothetical protein